MKIQPKVSAPKVSRQSPETVRDLKIKKIVEDTKPQSWEMISKPEIDEPVVSQTNPEVL